MSSVGTVEKQKRVDLTVVKKLELIRYFLKVSDIREANFKLTGNALKYSVQVWFHSVP